MLDHPREEWVGVCDMEHILYNLSEVQNSVMMPQIGPSHRLALGVIASPEGNFSLTPLQSWE